jgi:uncharacterized membrane protein
MPPDPWIRASDRDRDRVVALLREHHAAGRLDADEVHERIDKALEAKTIGDLDALMADLPTIDLDLPGQSPRGGTPANRPGDFDDAWPTALGLAAAGVTIAAYLISGVVFGIWWIPWWLLIVVPIVLIRRHAIASHRDGHRDGYRDGY